jgi:hypothetical protein
MLKMKLFDMLKVATPPKVRRRLLWTRFALRRPTSAHRVLPDFLIIGAMRAGTSSLYKYLGAHPLIVPALRKEIQFFSADYGKGMAWYQTHFPTRLDLQLLELYHGKRSLTFEATPDYLLHPKAAERAAQVVPHAKLIVSLRNPVDRAFSHYQHMYRLGIEPLSFEAAIEQENIRLCALKQKVGEEAFYDNKIFLRYSYFERGLYAKQLEVWFQHFSREQFLILDADQMLANPDAGYTAILNFLNLPMWKPGAYRNYSYLGGRTAKTQPTPKLSDEFRRELSARYAPHNERLFTLLARTFDW